MLNDKDMDVLIGRYAKSAAQSTPVEHPDADELNAFAEGALPAAARQRYLSHFADCDDCRKLVSQLAVAAGAGVEARIPASEAVAEPWWRKLGAVFAIPTLRYAASAAVLLAVVGVAFLVWRPSGRQNLSERANTQLIAQNQPQASPAEALQQSRTEESEVADDTRTETASATAGAQPTAPVAEGQKQPESAGFSPPPPPPAKATDTLAAREPAPLVAGAARAGDAPRSESSPSYAPAPANEKSGVFDRSREQSNVNVGPGDPRRNESYDKFKNIDRSRSGEVASNRVEDRDRAANQPTATMNKKDDSEGRRAASRVADERGARQEQKVAARKSEADRESSDEESPTRSAGGRKFKRQGNAWVDTKFKSSMSIRTVARGSEDFDKLDSGLRSIASQLSGEVVVVWKGKAYRIR